MMSFCFRLDHLLSSHGRELDNTFFFILKKRYQMQVTSALKYFPKRKKQMAVGQWGL